MSTIKKNRCYACNKIFCCWDCCNEHINKKHPKGTTDCPLCRSERLSVRNFDDPELLCHVVFHHMPLGCLMCGILLKNTDDLQRLGVCNRRIDSVKEATKSVKSPDTPTGLNKTSVEGDYNGNFRNLTSPPELSRNTSTPMQIGIAGVKTNFVFKVPKSPNISIKTPKTSNQGSSIIYRRNDRTCDTENIVSSNETNFKDAEEDFSSSCGSNYMSFSASSGFSDRTPLRSILSNRSTNTFNDASSYFTRSNNNAGRKLDSMEERDEEMGIEENVEMEMTRDARHVVISPDQSNFLADGTNRDSPREQKSEIVKRVRFSDQFDVKSDNETTDNEEFFEARQSLSEMSLAGVENLSTSLQLADRENAKNLEGENMKIEETNSKDSKTSEKKLADDGSSSSSSRVVMMIVVEKNGSVDAAEMAPLIDRGLEKLAVVTRAENARVDGPATPDVALNVSSSGATNSAESVVTSGGIFATMAHVMRIAFRSLPGANSLRNLSREPVGGRENLSLLSSTMETSAASTSVLTSLASSVTSRSAKRSRDTDEISSAQPSDGAESINDVKSPLPKRARGWHKIRAREPIARMRNNLVTSPRGVSMETQCFQQGSLSVGDTILPLPSRAHQSTQTD